MRKVTYSNLLRFKGGEAYDSEKFLLATVSMAACMSIARSGAGFGVEHCFRDIGLRPQNFVTSTFAFSNAPCVVSGAMENRLFV